MENTGQVQKGVDLASSLTTGDSLSKQNSHVPQKGESGIAGLLIYSSNEKMSIYQAMKKQLLTAGTALLLLEAQAATGSIIDPVTDQKLSVTEAFQGGIIGNNVYDKLLAAEKAVLGFKDPYTGDMISLFQAMKKDLVVPSRAIRLLEAQVATGGIIDPLTGHRVAVDAAYQKGIFDKELNEKLADPSDDTRGFFDPNTQENLSYLEMKQRCVTDPRTGFSLLIVTDKVLKGVKIQVDENSKEILRKTLISVKKGRFSSRKVTLWEILNSEYFTEEQTEEFIQNFKSGKVTVESIITSVTTIIEHTEKKKAVTFRGLRRRVSSQQLLDCKIIDQTVYNKLQQGLMSSQEVSEIKSVERYLTGICSIAGVFVETTNEKMSISQAMKKKLLMPGTALILLEAQAATGFLIDPVKNAKFTVDEAVKENLVSADLHKKLLSAERAVTGYKDPYTGDVISLFQALKKDLIVKDHGIRLLEAQIATGGIIDPVHSHRLPVEVAFQKKLFDKEMNAILADSSDDTKGFFDPNTKENLTYLQLMDRCKIEQETGLCLLCLRDLQYMDSQTSVAFQKAQFSIAMGKFQGRTMSIWEFLNSDYITDTKRREIAREFSSKKLTIEQIITIFITMTEETERTTQTDITVDGFRKKVSLVELLRSQVIDNSVLMEVQTGKKSVSDLLQIPSMRRYLQGESSIAGIMLEHSNEKMSISQAKKKKLLMPGTALILLEAQAATGFLIDPVKNAKFTVDEAVKENLVSADLHQKLLSAERAVTGYKDPYTGDVISLFQALKKDLIVKDHGIRLLEAQIATGGIIDPVHSHRLPVEVAYKRGMFDEEMNKVLSDAGDDTKGFFDPNTRENLTYLQLMDRCVKDPETGLCLLTMTNRSVKQKQGFSIEEIERSFRKELIFVTRCEFKGKSVSVWELIHSNYLTEEKREELIERYRRKEINMQTIVKMITTIIEETETEPVCKTSSTIVTSQICTSLTAGQVEADFSDEILCFSVWSFIHSKLFTEERRKELMEQYRKKEIDLETIGNIIRTMIMETRTQIVTSITFTGFRSEISGEELVASNIIDAKTLKDLKEGKKTVQQVSDSESVKKYLQGSGSIAGIFLERSKEKMSISQAMKKKLLMPGTALILLEAQAATGFLIDPVKNAKFTVDEAVKENLVSADLHQKLLSAERAVTGYKDPYTGDVISLFQALKKDLIVKDHGIRLLEAQIATGGIIDPVHSHRLPVEVAYKRGMFDLEMNKVLSDAGDDTKGFFDPNTRENLTYLQLMDRCVKDPETGLSLLLLKK
ncbi:plectin-like [Scyliorhinus canicula]|uniref:plectin-like n=1 Tax=Scyliorhinus canicula TaxID=7830 RepID=UPI0018F3D95C|nr:plectin-like [Scyliorhinus canicula]